MKYVFSLIWLLLTQGAFANDFLVPIKDASSYQLTLQKTLIPEHDHLFYMLVAPSFTAEYAVYLTKDKNGVIVVNSSTMNRSGFYSEIQKNKKGQRENKFFAVLTSAPLPLATSEHLKKAWESALLEREEERFLMFGLDGESYFFGSRLSSGTFETGKTWSPKKETKMQALVSLGKRLYRYPKLPAGERPKEAKALERHAEALIKRFSEKNETR